MAKILLVEDDNNLREIYEARLQAEGYDIVSARDGEEALTVAMKERPDLIISDVMMPKISGFDMLDIIRSTEETKNAKVIMMTALSQAEDKARADKLGADRYLVKSQVTLEDVAKVAREVLDGTAPAAPADDAQKGEKTDEATPTAATTPAPEPAVANDTPTPTPVPSTDGSDAPAAEPAADTPTPAATPDPTPAAATPVAPSTPAAVDPLAAASAAPADDTSAAEPATTDTPAPEPAATPAPAPATDDAAAPAVATAPTPGPAAEPAATTPQPAANPTELGESTADEQSAIAAQIESFIDSKKTSEAAPAPIDAPQPAAPAETPQPATTPEPAATPAPAPATPAPAVTKTTEAAPAAPAESSEAPAADKPKKKVIKPLSDPTASSGPDLEALAKKEEEKEQMAAVAQEVAAGQAATPETPAEQPAPAATETAQQPVIPHTNGTSIDGVVQQPAPEVKQPPAEPASGDDPNAIAL